MIKTVFKLLVAALIANAIWHVGTAYMTYYKFQDGTSEIAQFGASKSEDELKAKVMDLASGFDVPLAENAVTVRRENDHTYIDGSYQEQLEVAPGYKVPWVFKIHVDTMSYEGARLPGAK